MIATIVIHQNPEYFCADRFPPPLLFFSPISSIQSHGLPIVFECEQAGVMIATIVIHQNPEYFCADRFRQHLHFFTTNYSPLKVSFFQREYSALRVGLSGGWS